MPIDTKALMAEIEERLNVRLKTDDPIFATLIMNEAFLEQAIGELQKELAKGQTAIEEQTAKTLDKLQALQQTLHKQQVEVISQDTRQAIRKAIQEEAQAASQQVILQVKWTSWLLSIAGAFVLGAGTVWFLLVR